MPNVLAYPVTLIGYFPDVPYVCAIGVVVNCSGTPSPQSTVIAVIPPNGSSIIKSPGIVDIFIIIGSGEHPHIGIGLVIKRGQYEGVANIGELQNI